MCFKSVKTLGAKNVQLLGLYPMRNSAVYYFLFRCIRITTNCHNRLTLYWATNEIAGSFILSFERLLGETYSQLGKKHNVVDTLLEVNENYTPPLLPFVWWPPNWVETPLAVQILNTIGTACALLNHCKWRHRWLIQSQCNVLSCISSKNWSKLTLCTLWYCKP